MSNIPFTNRAISIRQPWAFLIVNGLKTIENRDKRYPFRGPILIHAGKTLDLEAWTIIKEIDPRVVDKLPSPAIIERGGIVGAVEIKDCVGLREKARLTETDLTWFFGPYGLVCRNHRRIAPIIPCRGELMIPFIVPDAVAREAAAQDSTMTQGALV